MAAILGRLAQIPVIVAVSYEVLRWGARHRSHPVVRSIFMPGIWLQSITTRQPDDSMIEVAIVSLQEALRADGEAIPEGSIYPARRSMAQASAESRSAREAAEREASLVAAGVPSRRDPEAVDEEPLT